MYHGKKFNSISHLVGAVLTGMGFGALLTVSIQHRGPLDGRQFYGVRRDADFALYPVDPVSQGSPPRVKWVLQKLDHTAIYLRVAGTYTPHMLVSLCPGSGPHMRAFIWGLNFCQSY